MFLRTPRFRPVRSRTIYRRKLLSVELLEDRSLLSVATAPGLQLLGKPTPAPQYQWDMTKINAPAAWAANGIGNAKVTVADIDTGIDYTHPDLYKNVWINQTEIPSSVVTAIHSDPTWDVDGDGRITFWDLNDSRNQGEGKITDLNHNNRIDAGDLLAPGGWEDSIDGDGINGNGNGYVDDLIGWDFVNDDNNPMDDNGHGTHTAGTIGAMHNGIGTGVDGVNGKTQIMALKAFDQDGGGPDLETALGRAIGAIDYSGNNGARVSNNSWGVYGVPLTDTAMVALRNAIAATPNTLFVSSAGNNGINNDTHWAANYPSSFDLDNIVAVAATTSSDQKPYWSNYGSTTVDLGAPGANVVSTVLNGGYASYSGTSMASPHVAGTAALILSVYPDLTTDEVKFAILNGVDSVKSMSNTVSGGRLNVVKALSTAEQIDDGSLVISGGASSSGAGGDGGGSSNGGGNGRGSVQTQATDGGDFGDRTIGVIIDEAVFGSAIFQANVESNRFLPATNLPERPSIPQSTSALSRALSAHTSFAGGTSQTETPPPAPESEPARDGAQPQGYLWQGSPSPVSASLPTGSETAPEPTMRDLPIAQGIRRVDATRSTPSAETEPQTGGFIAESFNSTVSKIIGLVGAALFFTQAALLGKSRDVVEEEHRERRPKL